MSPISISRWCSFTTRTAPIGQKEAGTTKVASNARVNLLSPFLPTSWA
uniref:LOX10 n=1 Tax=Arundo donax TaxID=35708 RepID=A0A0A9CFB7_ARUDO